MTDPTNLLLGGIFAVGAAVMVGISTYAFIVHRRHIRRRDHKG